MSAFEQAFRIVVGEEGSLSTDAADPGNWTGGRCGVGSCAGTKYGISAAAYPHLAIASLSVEAAREIYKRDYWDKLRADELPPPLALLLFDAAVNNGVTRAAKWLQSAVGVAADGAVGTATLAAVRARAGQGAAVLAEFQVKRLLFMTSLPTWRTFGTGWARRLCKLPFEAVQMGAG